MNCYPHQNKRLIGVGRMVILPVITNGEDAPLEGRDISLELVYPNGQRQKITDFHVEDNNIIWFFGAKLQTRLGSYTLNVYENKGSDEQVWFDKKNFITLVSSTEEETQ